MQSHDNATRAADPRAAAARAAVTRSAPLLTAQPGALAPPQQLAMIESVDQSPVQRAQGLQLAQWQPQQRGAQRMPVVQRAHRVEVQENGEPLALSTDDAEGAMAAVERFRAAGNGTVIRRIIAGFGEAGDADRVSAQLIVAAATTALGAVGRDLWTATREQARLVTEEITLRVVTTYDDVTALKLKTLDLVMQEEMPPFFTQVLREKLVMVNGASRGQMRAAGKAKNLDGADIVADLIARPATFQADVAQWNKIAGLIDHAATSKALFTSGDYRPRTAEVLAILDAAKKSTPVNVAKALLRNTAHYARINGHVAELELIAGRLTRPRDVASLFTTDFYLENLADLHALFQATPNVTPGAVLEASVANLPALTANRVALNRALEGEDVTSEGLTHVLAHLHNNAALPASAAELDAQIVNAQSLGAQLRTVMTSRLRTRPDDVHNLSLAVDTHAGVTWGNRGGVFSNGAHDPGHDYGGNIWVPTQISGFPLSNHAIAHLLAPRNAQHEVTVSNIQTALAHERAPRRGEGAVRVFEGAGLRMFVAPADRKIITIFFPR